MTSGQNVKWPEYNSYGSAVRVSANSWYIASVEIAILSTKGQRGNLVNTASVRATRRFACVFLLVHVGFAQKIMVRVINGRDEHPLSKQTVFALSGRATHESVVSSAN